MKACNIVVVCFLISWWFPFRPFQNLDIFVLFSREVKQMDVSIIPSLTWKIGLHLKGPSVRCHVSGCHPQKETGIGKKGKGPEEATPDEGVVKHVEAQV